MVKQQDTEYVRRAFRHLSRKATWIAAITCLVYSGLFYSGDNTLWQICLGASIVYASLDWILRPNRAFHHFLFGIVALFLSIFFLLMYFVFYVGSDMGFHYPMIIILPMIAKAGRVSTASKWIMATVVGAAIVWLDNYSALQNSLLLAKKMADPSLDSIDPFFKLLFRNVNTVVTVYSLTGLAKYYFDIVTDQQALLILHATRDPLTGLYNRRRIFEEVEQLKSQTKRYNQLYSVMLCDLDHFKLINDSLGHDIGDEVLKQVSSIFLTQARESDTVGRWGGEEFLILLPNTDSRGAMLLATRMCEVISHSPLRIDKKDIRVTVTIGVATLKNQETLDKLIGRADTALYKGKKLGRNQAVLESG